MASTRQAIIDRLRTYSTLTDLLGAGADSILVPGRLRADTPTPCLIVRAGPTVSAPSRLPHFQELWEVRVYYNPISRAGGRWPEVDEILGHIRGRLHDAPLSVDDGTLWKFAWDGFQSTDIWDYIVEMYCRVIRFRVYRSTSYW